MQGLGTGAHLALRHRPSSSRRWLPETRAGRALSAFALTEPQSGSDVAATATTATRDGDGYVLDGEKTWISNGGIADLYTVFARTGEAPGARGLSAFLLPADTPGLTIAERLETIAPHPLARLRFDGLRLPASALIGKPGDGFKIAMSVLDVFRSTVAAAALGFARRALDETLARATGRQLFGAPMADLQMVQGHLADMALDVDAAALLTYRAAWTKDAGAPRVTREAAMAKLFATDRAQAVIDAAVQLHGGDGVRKGSTVESLYREIRALRIYEGASDVQKVVIARADPRGTGSDPMTKYSRRRHHPERRRLRRHRVEHPRPALLPQGDLRLDLRLRDQQRPRPVRPGPHPPAPGRVHPRPGRPARAEARRRLADRPRRRPRPDAPRRPARLLQQVRRALPRALLGLPGRPAQASSSRRCTSMTDIPAIVAASAEHDVDFLPPEANE